MWERLRTASLEKGLQAEEENGLRKEKRLTTGKKDREGAVVMGLAYGAVAAAEVNGNGSV